ncbi:hypothetical protein DET49_1205 [Salegentibacter sp. 24]|uniref:alpha/beta hydrolase n=1 Tax=Salegentibacter sp. 24 TaxID=2183986 RepID=UPI0010E43516|nr:alpha/beta hydrolase [Salegentibacter sp. 24]TDN83806.1 hypothetical protein DET49_1205 [Salegentibacter sp. 24]
MNLPPIEATRNIVADQEIDLIIMAATSKTTKIEAIVSRGGRPDMAMPVLKEVKAPTLFIVGGNDKPVLELNKKAYEFLPGIKKIEIVEGATHLFEEPGKL